MAFHNISLPFWEIKAGADGGPVDNVRIIRSDQGVVQAAILSSRQIEKWKVTYPVVGKAAYDSFDAFFRVRRGPAHTFRFRSPSGYSVGITNNPATGVDTYTSVEQFGTGDGVTTAFQLKRRFVSGSEFLDQPIKKPQATGLRIYLNGVLQGVGYSVVDTTGVVTFAVAPGAGVVVGWAGYFDIEVRITHLDLRWSEKAIYNGEVEFEVEEVLR